MAQHMHGIILEVTKSIVGIAQYLSFTLWWGKYNWQPQLVVNSCLCGSKLVVNTIFLIPKMYGG
jgi:hypothetical protein